MSQPSSHATPSMTTGTGNQSNARLTRLQRLLLSFAATGSALLPAAIAWAGASSAPPGVIQNQATGSFTDPNAGTQNIESNIVEVTVAEIAGITVSASGFTEAPASVTDAGPYQGDGTINTQDVVYFTFDIINEGNDPTQFFIPGSATITNGSASGSIEIISYDTNGSSVTVLPTPIAVAVGGTTTGAALGLPLGSLAPGGVVRVRVPAKAATGLLNNDPLTVVLGDTLASNRANQNYSDGGANRDLYTQDNQNSDGVNVPATAAIEVEATGSPFNGDATFRRREASATQFAPVAIVPVDRSDAIASLGEATHVVVNGLRLGATIDSETSTLASANANGDDTNGIDDEDGISAFPTLVTGATSYSIPAANITATGTGQLHAWLDFNNNNTFESGEYASVAVTNGTLAGALNWSSITAGAVGNTYARFRFTSDSSITASTPSSAASNGEVEDYQVAIIAAPLPSSICEASGGILGSNLFANNGSFGTGSSTPGTTGATLPAGRTTYTPVTYGANAPNDGQYSIVNQLNQNTFNFWFNNVLGHTTGTVNDQMMVVNADLTPGTFYTETLTVPANQTMNFGFWIVNLPSPSSTLWTGLGGTAGDPNASGSAIKPNISLVVNRIGVDDDSDGSIDETGEGQVVSTTGVIPFTSSPTWMRYDTLLNTGNVTQMEFRFVNNAPGGAGNDLALDDLIAAPCTLPSGNISGTLYRDQNANNAYNSGTDLTLPANIAVDLKNSTGGIVSTAYTNAGGGYSFTNVPAGGNYTIQVVLSDLDIPSGTTATANPSGANTTGIQTGITVTAGATLADQNFGFSSLPIPRMLLVKRITAINRGLADEQLFDATWVNVGTTTDDDNAVNWPGSATVANTGSSLGSSVEGYINGITGLNNITAVENTLVRPGDQLEYTISFLSDGNTAAQNVLLCDRIPPNNTYLEDAFNTSPPAGSGTGDRGIFLSFNNLQVALTNNNDGDEIAATSGNNDGIGGYYFPAGINPSIAFSGLTVNCGGANTNGAIVVDLSDIPNATGDGTPVNAYGFVRFRVEID